MEVEEDGELYLSLHCHHQNDFCTKMGSDESHFNVSLIVRDKVTRQCPQITTHDVSKERLFVRTQAYSLQIFGLIPFVKLRNDT